jgi:hypothetical protein
MRRVRTSRKNYGRFSVKGSATMTDVTANAQEFDWDSVDASEAPRTIVLLGAGASADMGLPTASELHGHLVDCLGRFYANLATVVFGNGEVDVERLFRVIEFLHSVETEDRPQDRRSIHDSLDIARLVKLWLQPIQGYLESQAQTRIGSPSRSLIDELWASLLDLLWL